MGNRSYLTVSTAGTDIAVQCEANNSLPLFWIGLLDRDLVDTIAPTWRMIRKAHESGDDRAADILEQDPTLAQIEVAHDRFETNSRRTRQHLVRSAPEVLALFDDFTALVAAALADPDRQLMIDVLEYADFSTVDDFVATLHDSISALDSISGLDGGAGGGGASGGGVDCVGFEESLSLVSDDPIVHGTGFSDELQAASPHYRTALAARGRAMVAPRPGPPGAGIGKSLVTSIFMAATAVFFSLGAVVGLRDEGLTWTVVLAGLFGIVCCVYAAFEVASVRRRIRARRGG